MKPGSPQERLIRNILYMSIAAIIGLYISQAAFIHLRFYLIDAIKEEVTKISEQCDESNCTASWSVQPKYNLLLLGHIMRTHKLEDKQSGKQILPISRIKGITADSWSGLRVYEVEPNKVYILTATKPKAVKMDYFIGILPRSTNHEGILSVPDISPTVSMIAMTASFGLFSILVFAAFLAPSGGLEARKKKDELIVITVSGVFAAIGSTVSSGVLDSLMPDGELRSRLLRTSLVIATVQRPLAILLLKNRFSVYTAIFYPILVITAGINFYWDYFRAGSFWIASTAGFILILTFTLLSKRKYLAAASMLLASWDPLFMSGFIFGADIPPIYVLHYAIVTSFCLLVADLNAVSVIALASRAYKRFSRDLALKSINQSLVDERFDYSRLSASVKESMPKIAQLLGAGRVSILLNLPGFRPIIHTYTAHSQNFVTHDDGKIPGAVTVRSFVYGDEAWFEKYTDFSTRHEIPLNPDLLQHEYFCVTPIRVKNTNSGVLMLTDFDDENIEQLIASEAIDEERETGKILIDTLAAAFSEVLLQNLESTSSKSAEALVSLRNAIARSSSSAHFLQSYTEILSNLTGLMCLLHQRVQDRGVFQAGSSLSFTQTNLMQDNPFILKGSTHRAYGPTVIAFNELKSSYLNDWNEIREKLHPKSWQILEALNAKSLMAVPLSAGEEDYVLTMMSCNGQMTPDPSLMKVVESTEALFDAAVTVLNHRTSVHALGVLASRLIGDDQVRESIINAAKTEVLPTTIGNPRTSFLLLFDLVGSSHLSQDTEEKARSYGVFYDEVNQIVAKTLGGKIRKTIGDAVIVTWDGSDTGLTDYDDVLQRVVGALRQTDDVARKVGCDGVRGVLHFGDYFFGLVGTSSFGQIDVIGRGIDDVCKIEGSMKSHLMGGDQAALAVSETAVSKLKPIPSSIWMKLGFQQVSSQSRSSKDMVKYYLPRGRIDQRTLTELRA